MTYICQILTMICIYAMLAQSLNLVSGFGGMPSLCHGALAGLGGYGMAILTKSAGWTFLPALAASVAAAALVAWIAAWIGTRLKGDYFLLSTIAFQTVVYQLFKNCVEITGGTIGIKQIERPVIAGVSFAEPEALAFLAVVFTIASSILVFRLVASPFGLALQALRDDELAAQTLAKDPRWFKCAAFACSAGIAAVGGAFQAALLENIEPATFDLSLSILVFSTVIVGGAGSYSGPWWGAALLVLLIEGFKWLHIPDPVAAVVRQILYGAALILIMRFRPRGIAGRYAFD